MSTAVLDPTHLCLCSLGASTEGSKIRQQLQTASLISDMQAFKVRGDASKSCERNVTRQRQSNIPLKSQTDFFSK